MTNKHKNDDEQRENRRKMPKGQPFTKNDPRINRRGRPRTLGELRELIQSIGHETLSADGKTYTRIEALTRRMIAGNSPSNIKEILRYGWGEPHQSALNVDMSQLTDEQVQRIANGEDVLSVITTNNSATTRPGGDGEKAKGTGGNSD
jgi:hypothetical protein